MSSNFMTELFYGKAGACVSDQQPTKVTGSLLFSWLRWSGIWSTVCPSWNISLAGSTTWAVTFHSRRSLFLPTFRLE